MRGAFSAEAQNRTGGPLRVLLVGESDNDAALVLRELRRGGFEPVYERVDTSTDMEAALREADAQGEPFEIVISDYYMPRFKGLEALELLQEMGYDLPFIVVSSKVGEELAVEMLQAGAHDYVTKENLARLNPAVHRELRDAEVRRDRELAEEALQESQDRYQTFFDQSSEGILRIELEEPISIDTPAEEQVEHFYRTAYLAECNEAMARMYGFDSAEEVIGARLDAIFPRSVPGNVELLQRGVRAGYRLMEAEFREFVRGGRTRYFLTNLTGIVENGQVVRAWGTQSDITGQKRVQEALHQSEELYRAVVEQAAENIFLVDVETKHILECNKAFRDSLGYNEEEVEELTLYDLVVSPRESIDENARCVMEKGSHFVGKRQYRRKDGSLVDVEVNVSVVELEDQQVLCVVAHDITERKRAQEALEEARDAERNRIARDLHDDTLQNIVYALQEARTMQAASEDVGSSALENITEALRGSVDGLREAVFELRLASSLSRSFMVSLQSLLDTNRRMSHARYSLDLSMESRFPEQIPEAEGRQIIYIIQEALNNARKHAEASKVSVELGYEDGLLWVEVADDGEGFDTGTHSSGLGLSSMRQRAEELGGWLTVQSAPGAGSTVRLEIPHSA